MKKKKEDQPNGNKYFGNLGFMGEDLSRRTLNILGKNRNKMPRIRPKKPGTKVKI